SEPLDGSLDARPRRIVGIISGPDGASIWRALSRNFLALALDEEASKDFAGGGFRDVRDELDAADFLGRRDAPCDEAQDLRLGHAVTFSDDDESLRDFARLFVRTGNDGGVCDRRVREQQRFEFGGGDLEAFVLDEFFGAVNDVEVAFFVGVADIARVQPAVGVYRLRGGFGAVQIALHHLRAAHANLPSLAYAQLRACLHGDHLAFSVRHAHADRPGLVKFGRRDVRARTGLGHAVALHDVATQTRRALVRQLRAKRGRAGEDHLERREVVGVNRRVFGERATGGTRCASVTR